MTTITREPAVLPLSGILLSEYLHVRALTNRGGLKKGSDYIITVVRNDGEVRLVGNDNWHRMGDFVELLHPRAANDNATQK